MQNNPERKPFDLRGESKAYAIESIKLYQHLTEYAPKKEYTLSKHYLVAATRIGDFIRQEEYLEACHSASSAKYWLELLYSGGYIDNEQASAMLNYCDPLVRILYVKSHPDYRKDKEGAAPQAPVSSRSTAPQAPVSSRSAAPQAPVSSRSAAPQAPVSSSFAAGTLPAGSFNPFNEKGGAQ